MGKLLKEILLIGAIGVNSLVSPSKLYSEISKFTYDNFQPKIEYRNGASFEDLKEKEFKMQLEKVPDQIQRIMADSGGRLIFFKGLITDNYELRYKRGTIPEELKKKHTGKDYTWEDVNACYNIILKKFLLKFWKTKLRHLILVYMNMDIVLII